MTRPIAVLTSDVHYRLDTLELADSSLRQAFSKAKELEVPLVVAGDLHDTKANLRGECVKRIINTFEAFPRVDSYVLVGNHDRINEKSPEHSLEFLKHYTYVVEFPMQVGLKDTKAHLIPYCSSREDFCNSLPIDSELIICHQGLTGANLGDYVQDKSAITKEDVADYRVISGHYHCRQDIKCGRPRKGAVGLFSYIGNPYSLTFGEATDPDKGFQILHDNGILEFVPTNLPRHRICSLEFSSLVGKKDCMVGIGAEDKIWIKVSGFPSELSTIHKESLGNQLLGHSNYRLEKIPMQVEERKDKETLQGPAELMDSLIDKIESSETERDLLKKLWRSL